MTVTERLIFNESEDNHIVDTINNYLQKQIDQGTFLNIEVEVPMHFKQGVLLLAILDAKHYQFTKIDVPKTLHKPILSFKYRVEDFG